MGINIPTLPQPPAITHPSIMFGHVMHKRLLPKINGFRYRIYYLVFALSTLKTSAPQKFPIAVNRFGLLSFHTKDHGNRSKTADLEQWVRDILHRYNVVYADGDIVLITLPRVLGYVFNPVSFWICYDKNNTVRAVLCEVNNTFGETHTYLCTHPDGAEIRSKHVFAGDKVFHVSPFLQRQGHYTFRFDISDKKCGIWINYFNADGKKQLVTALNGNVHPLRFATVQKAFWAYPLMTLRAIALIHWQALKLLAKGIRYVPRPRQKTDKTSTTHR